MSVHAIVSIMARSEELCNAAARDAFDQYPLSPALTARLDDDGALWHPADFTEKQAQRLVRRPVYGRRGHPDFQRVAVHPG